MPLTDDGGINEKTNELATLIPQCKLDVEGEFFLFLFEIGGWCDCFPLAFFVLTIGLEVSSPLLFPFVRSPSILISLN